MRFLRTRPFLCLAAFTLIVGVIWHSPLVSDPQARASLEGTMRVIGAPFIAAMRLTSSLFGKSPLTPLAGLALGLAPYLLADWVIRRRLLGPSRAA
jgi:hypothetical protein